MYQEGGGSEGIAAEQISMNIDVFISHHTTSCLPVVEAIANKFESHGVRCWYAPRNTTGPYALSITNAIDSCRIFLLILNHQSSESFDVKNEINLACERIRHGEDILILPFRIAGDEISADVKYYIGRMHWIDAVTPPMEKRMNELLERVLLHLDRKASVELRDDGETVGTYGGSQTPGTAAEAARTEQSYRITAARMYPNSRFAGRQKEIADIHESLSGPRNKIFLLGMGGMGKSEIAKKYCDDYSDDYDIIKWVTFSDTLQETIASDQLFDIEGLQKADFPGDDERAYFQRKMHLIRSAGRRVLFVIDNFDVDGDADLDDFCAGEYSVIFTTRIRQTTESIPQVEIRPMEESELLTVFLGDAGYSGANATDADTDCILEIIRHLQLHTYGVRIAASVMKKQRMKPQEMLSLLRQDASVSGKRNVKKAESEILERIQKLFDLSSLNEEAVYILKNLYFMPLGGVPVELFADWCELDGYDGIDALIDRSWVVHEVSTDTIHLHPLISEMMAGPATEDSACCETMLKNMEEASEGGKYRTFEEKRIFLLCEKTFYEQQPKDSPYRQRTLILHIERLHDLSQYQECIQLCKDELEMPDLDETFRAYLYNKISHTLLGQGKYEEALRYAEEGWENVRDLPLDEISMKLGYYRYALYVRMCEANRILGNTETAIEMMRARMSEVGRFYVESPQQSQGWYRFHLAECLYDRNQPEDDEEALKLLEEALNYFREIDNEWSKSFSFDMMARILLRGKRYNEALEYNKKAYDILLPLLGDSHADIGNNLTLGGEIYSDMGETEHAKDCFHRALEIYQMGNIIPKAEYVREKLCEMDA